MNSISEQLLQAMEIVVDEKITKLEYDKTIKGKIYSIVNLDTGEYKVRYNGNIFSAFANDLSKTYKVNDQVYVNVPEGNFSNRKIITSKVSDQSLSQNQLAKLQNSVSEISPSFEAIYNIDFNEPVGVIAGAPADSADSEAYVCLDIMDKNNLMFMQYSNNYDTIRIKASFLTQFHDIHSKGNYGIEVEFYANDGTVVPYKLDFQNFNGDPYSFSVYSEQQVIVQVQKGYLLGLKSIKLFEEDFVYDKSYTYELDTNNQIQTIAHENKTEPNIFVKDVSIQYVEIKDLSDSNYHLVISPVKGIAFSNTVTSLQFLGRLVYEGEDIIKQADTCQWFVRDLDVVVGSNLYNKNVGVGWRAIEGANTARLEVESTEVRNQEKYKLLVIYKSVVLTAEIEIFNLNSEIKYGLEQVAEDNNESIALKITNPALVGDWYMLYPDGAYQAVDGANKVNSINIMPYLQYSSITFYVTVYDEVGKLGTLEYTITNSENKDDITVTYIGEDTFLYNASGDITIEDSEKERTLQATLAWKDGYATGYTISWTTRDGTIIPSDKNNAVSPDNSMLVDLWVDNYNVLHYNLKQKYKVALSNNIVCIKIETYTGQTYYFEKEILCLKDGDQGTNGTTYITAIRPCDSSGAKLGDFQALRYNGGWVDAMQLRCYVYKDGELINNNSNYKLTYKWTGYNIYINGEEDYDGSTEQVLVRGIPNISDDSTANTLTFYAKVQVDIVDGSKNISIYTSYPIDILVGSVEKTDIDITDIPSYIKYTSSGLTPSYYDNQLNFYYKQSAYNDDILSLNTDLLAIKVDDDGSKHLNPAASFIYENIKTSESNIAVLQFTLPDSLGRVIHPIIMYLDTYGNEAINGWDGTALDTGNGEYVFAPQVGAGEKDSANRFTGVVMGKDSGQNLIGLYGYQSGVNTFGLKQDGRAFFGAKSGGGQIIIDGYSGIISGGDVLVSDNGNITPAANGMYLRLANKNVDSSIKAFGIGYGKHTNADGREVTEENFYITYDGKLKATEADIQGKVYAVEGQIGGTQRSGGWTIKANRLYSGSGTTYVELNSNAEETCAIWAGSSSSATAITSKFAVTKTGLLYAKEGNIGGWELKRTYLQATSGTVGMASTGNAAFWAGSGLNSGSTDIGNASDAKFLVTRSGKLYCASATVRGDITADNLECNRGNIGGWTISGTGLSSNGISLYSDGRIYAGNGSFVVSSDGSMIANNANITGNINATTLECIAGNIGGWVIKADRLTSSTGNVELRAMDPNGIVIHTLYGDIGLVKGSAGSGVTTYNVGIDSTNGIGDKSIILNAGSNIALKGDWVFINSERITIDADPDKQYGIYARFA